MDKGDGDGPFTDRRRHPFDRAVSDVADGEDPRHAGLEQLQTWLQNTVVPDNPTSFVIRAVIVLALVALAAGVIRRRLSGPNPSEQPAHTGTTHDDQTTTSAVGLRAPTQP